MTNSDRAADDIEGVLFSFFISFQFSSSNNGNESDISDMNLSSGKQSQTAVRGLFQVQFCQHNGLKPILKYAAFSFLFIKYFLVFHTVW